MKYLKSLLLATGMVATTLSMSFSANAGAIIQQDIYLDVDPAAGGFSFDIDFGITETLNQLIGSITYATRDANAVGEIALDDVDLEINLGGLTLTQSDALPGLPILSLFDGAEVNGATNMIVDFEFDYFGIPYALTAIADTDFGGAFFLEDDFGLVVLGETRLGDVTYVPEPSALILMLAGLGLLVRRKVAAK